MQSSEVHSSGAAPDIPKERTSANARIATSVTIIAMLLLIGLANGRHVPKQSASDPRRQQEQSQVVTEEHPKAVRIVDPAFCENQTWPYIDARCLKRVDSGPTSEAQNTSNSSVPTAVPPKLIAAETAPAARQDSPPVPLNGSSEGSSTTSPRSVPAAAPSDSPQVAHVADDDVVHASPEPKTASTGNPEQFWGRPVAANEMRADSDFRQQYARHRRHHYGRIFGFRF
jgi:hypothetical protein